jgi:predicted nucleic acid-binding protein
MLIDLAYGVESVRERIRAWVAEQEEVAVCAIQLAEYMAGVAPANRDAQQQFLRAFVVWEISPRAALRAGAYRYDFARRGVQLGTADALIAAVAWEHSAILVTANARHFPMTDIRIFTL